MGWKYFTIYSFSPDLYHNKHEINHHCNEICIPVYSPVQVELIFEVSQTFSASVTANGCEKDRLRHPLPQMMAKMAATKTTFTRPLSQNFVA
jgi:hypothetical protein